MTFLNPLERQILRTRAQVKQMLNPRKALPWGPVFFQLWVGQVWGIDQLHSLPHGMCKITEESILRGTKAEAHITIGVYTANLAYSRDAGKFMVTGITEVREQKLREDLWSIAGRSLQELLGRGLAVRQQPRYYRNLGNLGER